MVPEAGGSVNEDNKHQGFLKEVGDGDRMGPWLSLHEEMFWMMINLEGIEQELGLGAQKQSGCTWPPRR